MAPEDVAAWLGSMSSCIPMHVLSELKGKVLHCQIDGLGFAELVEGCQLRELGLDYISPLHMTRMRKAWHADFPDVLHSSGRAPIVASRTCPTEMRAAGGFTRPRNFYVSCEAEAADAVEEQAPPIVASRRGAASPVRGSVSGALPGLRVPASPPPMMMENAWGLGPTTHPASPSGRGDGTAREALQAVPTPLLAVAVDRLSQWAGFDRGDALDELRMVLPAGVCDELAGLLLRKGGGPGGIDTMRSQGGGLGAQGGYRPRSPSEIPEDRPSPGPSQHYRARSPSPVREEWPPQGQFQRARSPSPARDDWPPHGGQGQSQYRARSPSPSRDDRPQLPAHFEDRAAYMSRRASSPLPRQVAQQQQAPPSPSIHARPLSPRVQQARSRAPWQESEDEEKPTPAILQRRRDAAPPPSDLAYGWGGSASAASTSAGSIGGPSSVRSTSGGSSSMGLTGGLRQGAFGGHRHSVGGSPGPGGTVPASQRFTFQAPSVAENGMRGQQQQASQQPAQPDWDTPPVSRPVRHSAPQRVPAAAATATSDSGAQGVATAKTAPKVVEWIRQLPASQVPDKEREALACAVEAEGLDGAKFTKVAADPSALASRGLPSPQHALKVRRAWEQVLREDACRKVIAETQKSLQQTPKAVKMVF
eukprot:TRINITY_DN42240_c0_g1_i1.p1 TRINITY_DN42240_c0_g1~~TRINITY_DN42240_c0_g1_i1.p1  ORF type:complete len:706 (-),score=140.37 TRINITY_DN42240_c0_g1_i1:214-2154(-)